jgi:hypothetical protein
VSALPSNTGEVNHWSGGEHMGIYVQRISAYLGFVWVALFFVGFWAIARFVPPPSPALGPQEIKDFFAANTAGIRVGMLINMLAGALMLPWCASWAVQMKRIEGRTSPLTYTMIMCGACLVLELIFPCAFWEVAAFRPEGDAEMIQRLNDLAWLPFLGILSTAVIQGFVMGAAILQDKCPQPAFPRWAGYFNFWIVMMFFPACFIYFFKSGPFAWNGLLAWWLIVFVFATWILVDTVVLLKAIRHQEAHPDPAGLTLDELTAEVERLRRNVN